MKTLVFPVLLFSTFSIACLHADEVRTYKKIDSTQAEVVIKTAERESTQAATYVDGKENQQFLHDLIKDKSSALYDLRKQIEKENCNKISTEQSGHIDGCGEVQMTNLVLTSFGRGGWDSSGAGYTFFVGFRQEGSGRFFDVSHMVTISENVTAGSTSDGQYNGKVTKTLNMGKITRIDDGPQPMRH